MEKIEKNSKDLETNIYRKSDKNQGKKLGKFGNYEQRMAKN